MTTIQEKKRVLGRGLDTLIPAARATAAPPKFDGEAVVEVRLEEIEPSPYQPRRHQDEAALNELAASIRATGVLQPIVLRYISPPNGGAAPEAAGQARYQLIAGERRWRASQRARPIRWSAPAAK